jgi:hypothetical protein
MFWLGPRRIVIVAMVNEGGIHTSYNDSPRCAKPLVNSGRTWAGASARDVEKLWGDVKALFGRDFRLHVCYAQKRDQPSNVMYRCQHFQTGPSSSATSPLQRPVPILGAYVLMNLSSYSIQFRPLCHSFSPESARLNQSHPSETTVLVTHALWQKQSQTCICCRVPFKPT